MTGTGLLLAELDEAALRRPNPEIRRGQAAFNRLAELRPDIAERIRGTEADPFGDDQRMRAFYRKVIKLHTEGRA